MDWYIVILCIVAGACGGGYVGYRYCSRVKAGIEAVKKG